MKIFFVLKKVLRRRARLNFNSQFRIKKKKEQKRIKDGGSQINEHQLVPILIVRTIMPSNYEL